MSLINREALLSYADLRASCGEHYTAEDVIMMIKTAPTVDAVPVVRCFECENHYEFNGEHYCKFWRMYCPDDSDFFCKAGKRKEGADNDT